jgi:hypothetical protein
MFDFARTTTALLIISLVTAGTGCKKDQETGGEAAPSNGTAEPSAALPDDLFINEPPEGARSVEELKADADAKGKVVIRGRIGGRREPFVKGAAVFLLADASLKSCDELHGDACKTPWDYCCESPDSLAAKVATVQIVGEDGKPLTTGLKGQPKFAPLSTLTIEGEIANRDGDGTLVINARKIYVEPRKS